MSDFELMAVTVHVFAPYFRPVRSRRLLSLLHVLLSEILNSVHAGVLISLEIEPMNP